MMNIMNKIDKFFCYIGIHDWRYDDASTFFPYAKFHWHIYNVCLVCGKERNK